MSFQQGLSGLYGAAKSLDVIGNNIANSSTVGFKGSTTQFADVYASSLNGVGGKAAGIGVKVAAIAQQFAQGNIETSANPLDIAINGGGFFRIEQAGVVQYSRNGQFSLDKSGYIVNAQGAQLTGYTLNKAGLLAVGAPEPLRIDNADLAPKVTTKVTIELQLDSRASLPVNMPFDASDPTTYNKQSPMNVYDTLGNPHTLSTYYVKTAGGQWDVYVSSDGTEITALAAAGAAETDAAALGARQDWEAATKAVPQDPAVIAARLADYATAAKAAVIAAAGAAGATVDNQTDVGAAADNAGAVPGNTPADVDEAMLNMIRVPAVSIGKLNFDTNGRMNMVTTGVSGKFDITLPIVPSTGAELTLPLQIDYASSTQYGTATSEKRLEQDGYKAGSLQRFSAGLDGVILGQYSNGQTKPLGQIILVKFPNENGLEPLGNNAWAETWDSGMPLTGVPNTGGMGVLQSSATEASSVDLTYELVNMITAQRVYQANAQTIKTQDSVLQTLVNLR